VWVSDEWSGGDAVAVTRKNSYTGLVYYNNITSSEVTENKRYPSSSCSMVLTYNTNDSSVNQDVPQGKTIISLGIDPYNFLYTRTSVLVPGLPNVFSDNILSGYYYMQGSLYLSKSSDGDFQNIVGTFLSNSSAYRITWMEFNVRRGSLNYLKFEIFGQEDNWIFNFSNNYSIRNSITQLFTRDESDIIYNEYSYNNCYITPIYNSAINLVRFKINSWSIGSGTTGHQFDINSSVTVSKVFKILFYKKLHIDYKNRILIILGFGPDSSATSNPGGINMVGIFIFRGAPTWNYIDDNQGNNFWFFYNNIPSAITDDFGLNAWVTTDMKTLMYCKRGNYGIGKGINTVTSSNSLFSVNIGWNEIATYSINDSSTADLRNTLANYYVLEIQFNKNENKMIVLCNDTVGAQGGKTLDQYIEGIHPTHLFTFMYNGKKWVNIPYSTVGFTNFWNKYISSGSSGAKYKPFFNVNPNYLGSWDMSYSFPSYNENTTAYYAKLTFGD
jgi:hypothetical protein